MDNYRFISISPPIIAIIHALRTIQVYIAFLFGIWSSWVTMNDWNFINGTLAATEAMVNVSLQPPILLVLLFLLKCLYLWRKNFYLQIYKSISLVI